MLDTRYTIQPIGVIHSELKDRELAPRHGYLDAPEATLEIFPALSQVLVGVVPGDEIILITWLHQSERNIVAVHPHYDPDLPFTAVFDTRSPDQPNPLGLHRVKIFEIAGNCLKVGPLEAIDGTPFVRRPRPVRRSIANSLCLLAVSGRSFWKID